MKAKSPDRESKELKPVIVQSVLFKDSADRLFDAYLDPTEHARRVGRGAVIISDEPGAMFTVFDGGLRGRNIAIVPKRQIVQLWRASTDRWRASDPSSVLILTFSDTPKGGRIDLVQLDVPPDALAIIRDGWKQHYWKPWGGRVVSG